MADPTDERALTVPVPIVLAIPAKDFINLTKLSKLGPLKFLFIELPKSFIPFIAFVTKPTTLFIDFPKISVSFTLSRKFESQSPNEPVASKTSPPRPLKLPTSFITPPENSLRKVTPISITENKPLKVDFSFPD